MNPVDERFEHRLLDRFHYDDRQDGDGYGPDSPRVGDKGWIIWQTAFNELDRPFEIVRDEGRGRTGLPLLLVGMEDNYGDDWHIRENDDSQYMSLLEAGLDGASLTLMERKHGIARWRSERGESKPIELTAPDGKPTDTVYAYQSEPDEWRIYDKYGGRSLGGEPVEPPTGIDGFRTDTIYDFKDLDVLSATFAITHLYSGFNPNHHVIVRAHESYTDPPAPVIDSINNRQLRQSGSTRYLKVSRTVLDKEK